MAPAIGIKDSVFSAADGCRMPAPSFPSRPGGESVRVPRRQSGGFRRAPPARDRSARRRTVADAGASAGRTRTSPMRIEKMHRRRKRAALRIPPGSISVASSQSSAVSFKSAASENWRLTTGDWQPSYFPTKFGFRFSRNARTPSSLSSLAKQSANRSTSRRRPSSRLARAAVFTASFAIWSATGLFSAIL